MWPNHAALLIVAVFMIWNLLTTTTLKGCFSKEFLTLKTSVRMNWKVLLKIYWKSVTEYRSQSFRYPASWQLVYHSHLITGTRWKNQSVLHSPEKISLSRQWNQYYHSATLISHTIWEPACCTWVHFRRTVGLKGIALYADGLQKDLLIQNKERVHMKRG